jgi:uncharacterized protein (TIGR03435 family)
VDRTLLGGAFDLHFEWAYDALPPRVSGADLPPSDPNGASIFTSLQEQLGLKLESTKDSIDVLVVDQVERPTPD